MKTEDLMMRVSDLFSNMLVLDDTGSAVLSPAYRPLVEDIAKALQEDPENEMLSELSRSLEDMATSVANPAVAQIMYEGMTKAVEPNPEIFDAIDDGDVAAIEQALLSWDINQTHGEYDSTALYHAMAGFEVSLEVIDFLLDAGADPRLGLTNTNVLHGLGFANLQGIAPEDLAQRIRRCVELGADIEQRTNKLQWTPLITAASEWNPVAAEALLMAGADIGARAGEVEGVCFSGSDVMSFADGHAETMDVLKRYANPN
ncbi:MAG: hypothetical protein HKP37_07010 [Boseongicola sp.]|nr:hypothetical protein [Boseongicola sp.]